MRFYRIYKWEKLTGESRFQFPLVKHPIEVTLEAAESHISNDVLSGKSNRRRTFSKKTIKGTNNGSFELEMPCNINGKFEPQIVKTPNNYQ